MITALPLSFPLALAQDRSQGRSMVMTTGGIVATSQTLASQAGAQVLARGGSAIDAAIAANAVLGLVEPMMNGIGGDLFVLYREAKTGKIYGLNASGPASRTLTTEFLRQKGHKTMPADGIHTVTVPGCVDGWDKMHKRFGRVAWQELFRPAIHYARNGFPVTEIFSSLWLDERSSRLFREFPEGGRIFLPGGKPPAAGQVFKNPDLAKAYELIAKDGAAAFYRGPIAQAILTTSEKLGGTLSAEDLREFSSEWVEPISTDYRGWTVYELPPNVQGLAALEAMNIATQFPAKPALSADSLHVQIEAMKLAFGDLMRYNADPKFAKVPTLELLSKKYAAERAALIQPGQARCKVEHGIPIASGDTTYLTVIDREGNIASWIQSVSSSWGSGVVAEGMGFLLHNRGAGFVLDATHPNALAPRKRPFHTIIPAMMQKGHQHIGFGIMGGPNQPQAHLQFVSHVADHGMNIQAALEAPRFTLRKLADCEVFVERRIPDEVRNELKRRGHDLVVRGDYSATMGRGQAVMLDAKTGVHYGASDPRGDGAAIPEPAP